MRSNTPLSVRICVLVTLAGTGCSVARAELPTPETNREQALYLQAHHAVSRWTNHIRGTGAEVIEALKDTQAFADDVAFRFNLGGPEPAVFDGLDDAGLLQFYSDFFDPMPSPPFYFASNVEALEYGPDFIRFRFHHMLLIGGQIGLMGDNVVVLKDIEGRFVITNVEVTVVHFDSAVLTGAQ